MTVGKQKSHRWTIHYDLDGRVKAVNEKKVEISRGLVRKFGDLSYKTDPAGFVLERGSSKFGYDSFGRMTGAVQEGAFDLEYQYDENSRLAVRRSGTKLLHFYYALLDWPGLLTHVYDSETGTVTVYHYDLEGRLFSVEQSGSRFYVQTDPDASPLYVFNDDGSLVKSILRGPFGEVIRDSYPEFELFVGFRGMVQDPETGLVLFNGRPMDPLIGRWMSVTVEDLLAPVDPYHPGSVDLMRFEWTEDLNRELAMSAKDWLSLSGLEMDRVVPLLANPTQISSLSQDSLCPATQHVSLGSECSLRKRIRHFQQFLSTDTSKVLPKTPFTSPESLHWAPSPAVYGEGVTVTNYSGLAVLEFSASADPLLQSAMLVLLNESAVLPVVNLAISSDTKNGPAVEHFFWKPDPISAREDLESLGIGSERATLTSQLNVSISDVTDKRTSTAKLIKVRSKLAGLSIYYGGESPVEASEYFSDAQLDRMSDSLWRREARTVKNKALRTKYGWSEKELEELSKTGRVDGYLARRREETDSLLLAGDSWFLQLEKTAG